MYRDTLASVAEIVQNRKKSISEPLYHMLFDDGLDLAIRLTLKGIASEGLQSTTIELKFMNGDSCSLVECFINDSTSGAGKHGYMAHIDDKLAQETTFTELANYLKRNYGLTVDIKDDFLMEVSWFPINEVKSLEY